MVGKEDKVLQDYVSPQASDITSSIVSLAIKANNFKLRPILVTFVERDQFVDTPLGTPTCIFIISLRYAIL